MFYSVSYFSLKILSFRIFLLKIFTLLNSSLQAVGRTYRTVGWQPSNIYVNLIIVNLINDYDYNTVYKADYNNKHHTFTTVSLRANTRYDRQEMIMNLFYELWESWQSWLVVVAWLEKLHRIKNILIFSISIYNSDNFPKTRILPFLACIISI